MEARREAAAQAAADGRGWFLRLGARRCAGRGGGLRAIHGAGPRGAAAEPGARDGLPTPHRPGLAPLTGCPTADRVHLVPPGDAKCTRSACPVGRLDVADDRRGGLVRTGRYQVRARSLLTPEAGSRPVREGSAGACPRLPTHHACRPPGARRPPGDERAGRGLRPAATAARGCGGLRRLGRRLEAGAARAGRPAAGPHPSPHRPRHGHAWRRPRPAWPPAPTRWIAPARRPGPRSRSPWASCRTSRSRGWPVCSATCCRAARCWRGRAACGRC